MAHKRNFQSTTTVIGVIVISAAALSAGCAANPVFKHRFSHCMEGWVTEERYDSTVYPKGYEMAEYCWNWARKDLPTVAITPDVPVPASQTSIKQQEEE